MGVVWERKPARNWRKWTDGHFEINVGKRQASYLIESVNVWNVETLWFCYHERSAVVSDVTSCYAPLVPVKSAVAEIPVLSTITNEKNCSVHCGDLKHSYWSFSLKIVPGSLLGYYQFSGLSLCILYRLESQWSFANSFWKFWRCIPADNCG